MHVARVPCPQLGRDGCHGAMPTRSRCSCTHAVCPWPTLCVVFVAAEDEEESAAVVKARAECEASVARIHLTFIHRMVNSPYLRVRIDGIGRLLDALTAALKSEKKAKKHRSGGAGGVGEKDAGSGGYLSTQALCKWMIEAEVVPSLLGSEVTLPDGTRKSFGTHVELLKVRRRGGGGGVGLRGLGVAECDCGCMNTQRVWLWLPVFMHATR